MKKELSNRIIGALACVAALLTATVCQGQEAAAGAGAGADGKGQGGYVRWESRKDAAGAWDQKWAWQDYVLETPLEKLQERWPDADTVILGSFVSCKYEPDGTSVETDDEIVLVLTEKGKRDARTASFRYSRSYGRANVKSAWIYRPNRSNPDNPAMERIDVDCMANCKEMVEPGQMNSNIYDPNNKVVTLSFPGVEIGDIVRYKVERKTTKARVPNTWCDYEVLEWDSPILAAEVLIDAPGALPLGNTKLRECAPDDVAYERREMGDGRVLHIWRVQDVPQVFAEPAMPEMYTVVRHLIASTIPDWEYISRWYSDLCEPRLGSVNDEMREMVRQLTDGVADRDERIRRVFSFVSQKIRYMGITLEDTAPGYEPHDVSITFDNRYGVCRDKAALLVAMLRLAGENAYPVLINVGPRKDAEVPQPYFNHAIVAVDSQVEGATGADKYILMDPTDEKTKDLLPSYLRNKSFLVAHPEGETILDTGPAPSEDNLAVIRTEATLSGNGDLAFDTEIRFDGINDNIYRGFFARRKPEERKRLFENVLARTMQSPALDYFEIEPEDLSDTSKELVVRLSGKARNHALKNGDAIALGIPWLGGMIGAANYALDSTALTKRRFPMKADPTSGIEESVRMRLDKSYGAPIALPDVAEIPAEDGICYARNVRIADGGIEASRSLHIKSALFSPEQYQTLRDDLKKIESWEKQEIVFAVPDAARDGSADVRIVKKEIAIDIASKHEWTNTTHTITEVLTYAGVKDHSEIELSYNPAWTEIDVLEARVTMPDGTVRQAGKDEINEMDAPWVAGAPRFPAGHVKVISLPGVEVGSVIETKIRTISKDRPFCSARIPFGEYNPIDEMTVAVSYPQAMKGVDSIINGGELVPDNSVKALQYNENQRVSTVKDGVVNDVCTIRDLKALKKEPASPPLSAMVPTFFVSTKDVADKASYDSLLGGLIEKAATGKAVDAALAPIVAQANEELAGLIKDGQAPGIYYVSRWVRDYVARNIRIAGPSFLSLPADKCVTPVDVTLRDGYGTRMDTAAVTIALLRALGVGDGHITMLLATGAKREIAKLGMWENMRDMYTVPLVLVENGLGARYWLNEGTQYDEIMFAHSDGCEAIAIPLGDNEATRERIIEINDDEVTRLDPAGDVVTDVSRADGYMNRCGAGWAMKSGEESECIVRIFDNGDAAIEIERAFYGARAGTMRQMFSEMTPELLDRFHQSIVNDVSQSAMPDGELRYEAGQYPVTYGFKVKVPGFCAREGDLLSFDVPCRGAGLDFILGSERRENPWMWTGESWSKTQTTILLDGGIESVVMRPAQFGVMPLPMLSKESAAMQAVYEGPFAGSGIRSIGVVTTMLNQPGVCSVDTYPSLYAAAQRLRWPGFGHVILRLSPEAAAAPPPAEPFTSKLFDNPVPAPHSADK